MSTPALASTDNRSSSLSAAERAELRRRIARRVAERGGVPLSTVIKVTAGWGAFLLMSLFYAMLPIASLQLLPFLFFGTVCLLTSIYDDTGLSGDCK